MEPDDAMLALTLRSTECYRTVPSAIAIVFHTFEELESQVISVMSVILPPVYAIGPLPLLIREAGAGAGGDHAATTSAGSVDSQIWHLLRSTGLVCTVRVELGFL